MSAGTTTGGTGGGPIGGTGAASAGTQADLLTLIRQGKTTEARIRVWANGWLSRVNAANHVGVPNPEVEAFVSAQRGLKDAYVEACIEGGGGDTGAA